MVHFHKNFTDIAVLYLQQVAQSFGLEQSALTVVTLGCGRMVQPGLNGVQDNLIMGVVPGECCKLGFCFRVCGPQRRKQSTMAGLLCVQNYSNGRWQHS